MARGAVVGTIRTHRPPTRSCVACRTAREKRDLLRIVRAPDGRVGFDPSGRANGRGAYVCRDAACIDTAVTRGALARVLESRVPADLRDVLMNELGLDAGIPSTESSSTPGGIRGQE